VWKTRTGYEHASLADVPFRAGLEVRRFLRLDVGIVLVVRLRAQGEVGRTRGGHGRAIRQIDVAGVVEPEEKTDFSAGEEIVRARAGCRQPGRVDRVEFRVVALEPQASVQLPP
jgi:hypothetical protein